MGASGPVLEEAREFLRNRVVLSAARLDLFTLLEHEPRGAAAVAAALDGDLRATTRLLDCLVHRALEPGGVLVIRDFVMSEDRTEPPGGALFALNMLVVTEGGDTYTFSELEGLLRGAGFTGIELFRGNGGMDDRVEASK